MQVPVRCSRCGLPHRAVLRDIPDGRIVCPFCEHGAQIPEEGEIAAIEHQVSRERLLTALGVSLFGFAMALAAASATLSESHPGEGLFGTPMIAGAALLGLLGLVVTVMQESKASLKVF